MAELKTRPTSQSVNAFINKISDPQMREDCLAMAEIMQSVTRSEPTMWGANIVGFGTQRIKYASGREMEWMVMGFSPRKQNLTLYGVTGSNSASDSLEKLGKHTLGKGCLYIKRLSDLHLPTLKKLIREAEKRKQKTQHAQKTQ